MELLVPINLVIAIVTTLVNLLFVLCLICPIKGEQIKQPLMLLLATLITCTTSFELSVILQLLSFRRLLVYWLHLAALTMFIFFLSTTMTTSVWLAFFYNTQIVPAKRAACVWIKKNIKVVIYSVWLLEKTLSTFHVIVLVVYINSWDLFPPYWASGNFTLTFEIQEEFLRVEHFYLATEAVVTCHYFFCMCVMAMFNTSTVIYLCQHMRRMMINGKPVFSPQLRSQLRLTVTCALQGVMLMCCTLWSIKKYVDQGRFADTYSQLPLKQFTAIHLYMACMTLSLGAGQAVFRQRAVQLWRRLVCCCKKSRSDQEE